MSNRAKFVSPAPALSIGRTPAIFRHYQGYKLKYTNTKKKIVSYFYCPKLTHFSYGVFAVNATMAFLGKNHDVDLANKDQCGCASAS